MEHFTEEPEHIFFCGICGGKHIPQDCDIVPVKYLIPDKVYPSKAKLSLPDDLVLTPLADSTYRVTTSRYLDKGTAFGPVQAKKMCSLLPSIDFPLKLFTHDDDDFPEYYLDTSDEYECNWMIFIKAACNFEEQNMIIYQQEDELFYVTSRDVREGEELKVWYSPHYALKMQKNTLVTQVSETEIEQEPDDLLVKNHRVVAARDIWNCKFCGKVESKITEFTNHLLVHYRAISTKTCEICKDSFANKRLYHKHLKMVHNSKIPLETKLEPNAKVVQKILTTDNPKETPFGGPLLMNDITCDSLDNTTLNLMLPQSMELNQDNLLEQNLNMDSLLNENVKDLDHFNFELNEPEWEQLICDVCLKTFTTLKNLITHLHQHTGKYTCFDCKKVFTRPENLKYHSCKGSYSYRCPTCNKLFYQKKSLNLHMKVYHGQGFSCKSCRKAFTDKDDLEKHEPCEKKRISAKKNLRCKLCDATFKWQKNLMLHIKKHHKAPESFPCPECGRVLHDRRSYTRHLGIHKGSELQCDICFKCFKRKDSLSSHKKNIHENVVVTCDICDLKLSSVKHLKEHQKTHNDDTKVQCALCNAMYKNEKTLQKHVLQAHKNNMRESKTDSYEFSCPECQKKIKLIASLRRHMKIYHPGRSFNMNNIGRKVVNEDDELDLKQTIENMDFNTDEVNNCSENNDINMEIDKILNNDTMFLNDSNDRLVDTLIETVVTDANMKSHYENKGVCLSMPDLSDGNEIKLSDNVYTMEDGIKRDSSEVVMYILDNNKNV